MQVLYNDGVQVGRITFDPRRRVPVAFWTHRPAKRPAGGRILTSDGLARRWPGTIGLPIGHSGVAMGLRLELLASGYGASGVAVMATRAGLRTLVVGPTSTRLVPRAAERMVLWVPPVRDPKGPHAGNLIHWLKAHLTTAHDDRLVVPDGATAEVVCQVLAQAGVPSVAPKWLGGGRWRPGALRISTAGEGLLVDARPQADWPWLADLVEAVAPEQLWLHGPGAADFGAALSAEGWPVHLLTSPAQLPLVPVPVR
ncbi:MAG: hypothetical protein ACE366_25015 [Bradymonadia bacterium]